MRVHLGGGDMAVFFAIVESANDVFDRGHRPLSEVADIVGSRGRVLKGV